VEDFIDALEWAKKIGGLQGLIDISNENLRIIKDWVKKTDWVDFLAQDEMTISNTSICLRFSASILNELDLENQNLSSVKAENIMTTNPLTITKDKLMIDARQSYNHFHNHI